MGNKDLVRGSTVHSPTTLHYCGCKSLVKMKMKLTGATEGTLTGLDDTLLLHLRLTPRQSLERLHHVSVDLQLPQATICLGSGRSLPCNNIHPYMCIPTPMLHGGVDWSGT